METILDQRAMYGGGRRADADEVVRFWQEHAEQRRAVHGQPFPNRPHREQLQTERKAELAAYVSEGRWVADCPARDCAGGIALWRDHDKACCLDCGTIYTSIRWPDEHEHAAAEDALGARPPGNRNWRPWQENAEDLRRENIQHGYPPSGLPAAGSTAEIAAAAGMAPADVERVLRALERAEKTGGPAVLDA